MEIIFDAIVLPLFKIYQMILVRKFKKGEPKNSLGVVVVDLKLSGIETMARG